MKKRITAAVLCIVLLLAAFTACTPAPVEKGNQQKPSLAVTQTATSLTVTAVQGAEYKLDDGDWQDGNVFTGLTPGSTYTVYIRMKATKTLNASESVSQSVTLEKDAAETPVLTVTPDTNKITVTAVQGAEYKLDDGGWQDENVFTGLTPGSAHTVYIRMKETATAKASNAAHADVTLAKESQAAPSVATTQTATSLTVTAVENAEYKLDDGNWQDGNVFTGLTPGSTHTVYVRLKETSTHAAGASESSSVTLPKADQTTPAIALADTAANSITVSAVTGAEYSLDGETWQDAHKFTQLAPETQYTVYMRLKSTDSHFYGDIKRITTTTLEKDNVDVVIIAGQSNALGISRSAEIGINDEFGGVQIYMDGENGKANGKANSVEWQTVKTGLGLNFEFFGPEIGIVGTMKDFYRYDSKRLAVIKYTWGGTAMWDWWLSPSSVEAGLGNTAFVDFYKNVTGDENCARLYWDLLTTVRNGVASLEEQNYGVNLRGMAWMQGETDAANADAASDYETVLTNFINDLRRDLNAADMPIAIGQINTCVAGYEDAVRAAQARTAQNTANCTLVTTGDLEMGFLDWWHFRARDMVKLGQRFAGALMNYYEETPVVSADSVSLSTGKGVRPDLPQFVWGTTADGRRKPVPVTFADISPSAYAQTGTQSLTASAGTGANTLQVNAALEVHNGAKIDGITDDDVWETATAHEVTLYTDIYANPLTAPQKAVTATFKTAAAADGLYFAIDVSDPQIDQNFTNNASFDWDMCLNDGIELYVDASGSSPYSLTGKSVALWLTASNILRIYAGNDSGFYEGYTGGGANNAYSLQQERFGGIKRAVKIYGTPNQDGDTDTGYSYEIFVPYSVFGGETDLSKYRVALGVRSLAWLPGGFEVPYGAVCAGPLSAFSNGKVSSWLPYGQLTAAEA